MLNVERLRVLWAVANHGAVGLAARNLHVTTSAVSQQIDKLEREVGQELVVRQGRGVRLTDAGRLLAEHARDILSRMEQAEADLAAQQGSAFGWLTVGAFPTAARGLMPQALARLRRRHPGLTISLRELEPEWAVTELQRGDMDLALVLDWATRPLALSPELRRIGLMTDLIDVALPAGHRLAGKAELDLADLAAEPWIAWPQGEMCREWLETTLHAMELRPRIAHTAGEHQTQLALVAAGLGVAVAPRLGRHPVPEGVVLVPVRDSLRRNIQVAWRADSEARPSVAATVQVLQEVARTPE
ncbi:DNA-binding transcriptional LysR family regulator [Stackebrandtia albiflava]|uniref:DNA-binding transcriptional LysR family regulator n=1 Tax=Stackebrandtia albiflava TaxID=406432 RepID=A0A562V2F1_9ACTN|nr:LysR family transcriptional regulator [Stackebrandtia albiflava]TWJ12054.1 DNA-binding transcriptional LysR family regulator [Stackebrandtia albiflava]